MEFFNKVFELHEMKQQANRWRLKSERIVFTNGCFDILHPGHVSYLHEAKNLGNRLIVGLNTDASVRRLGKSEARPYNHEQARASVLAALVSVDAIILFDEDTPLELIKALEPDVLVKGGDYDPNEVEEGSSRYMVGSKEMRKRGAQVVSIPFLEGFSTTQLVHKITAAGE